MARLAVPAALKTQIQDLLGGKRPTPDRLVRLLSELQERRNAPMAQLDDSDKDAGRVPYTAAAHVAAIPDPTLDEAAALENVEAARAQRQSEGRRRVADRIEENRARGLDPAAPPEDAAAAALGEIAPPPATQPEPEPGFVNPLGPDQPNLALLRERANAEAAARLTDTDEDVEVERRKTEARLAFRQHTDRVEREALQRLPSIIRGGGVSRMRSLEEAAAIIVAELQPNEQDTMADVVREIHKEPWEIILAAVGLAIERQELHQGNFDPDWSNRPSGARPASVREQKCETCQGLLPGDAKRGQRFCCNAHGSDQIRHTEGCPLAHLQMQGGRWIDTRGARA